MLYNKTKNKIIAWQPLQAAGFAGRLRGLMFRASFPAGCDALLLYPCRGVHTFFMRFAIDVLLVNDNWQVISTCKMLRPGKVRTYFSTAACGVELPGGVIENSQTAAGDQLVMIHGAECCSIMEYFNKKI